MLAARVVSALLMMPDWRQDVGLDNGLIATVSQACAELRAMRG